MNVLINNLKILILGTVRRLMIPKLLFHRLAAINYLLVVYPLLKLVVHSYHVICALPLYVHLLHFYCRHLFHILFLHLLLFYSHFYLIFAMYLVPSHNAFCCTRSLASKGSGIARALVID